MPKGVYIRTEETRKKMRKKKSKEHAKNIGLAKTGIKSPWYGKKFSEEHKQKISEGCKKADIGAKLRGRKLSEEHKKNISLANKGELNYFYGKRYCGKDNYFWEGGRMKRPYGLGWTTILKESIRARDNFKCQKCGVPQEECDVKLCVHHKNQVKTDLNPSNLVSLCTQCHTLIHNELRRQYKKEAEKAQGGQV